MDDLARWQGIVDATLAEHDRRLQQRENVADEARKASEAVLVEIAVLKTKVALYGLIGGALGAGAVSGIVAWVTG